MKKILFLTTGGTIACTVTDEGLEPTLKGEGSSQIGRAHV